MIQPHSLVNGIFTYTTSQEALLVHSTKYCQMSRIMIVPRADPGKHNWPMTAKNKIYTHQTLRPTAPQVMMQVDQDSQAE